MKILFDCHTFDAGPQGTSTFLAGLINALPQAAGDRGARAIDIYCAARSRTSVDEFISVPYHYVPMAGGFAWRNLVSLPRLSRVVGSDVVVSQYVTPAWVHGRTVVVIHDVLFLDFPRLFSWSYRAIRRVLFGWSARVSDRVVTVSSYSADRIADHFGVPRAAIAIIPNAVCVAAHEANRGAHRPSALSGEGEIGSPPSGPLGCNRSKTRSREPIKLLYVSRLEQRKRQDWCIQAAEAIAARGRAVELVLVGAGDDGYAKAVRNMAAERRAGDACVSLLSNVPSERLRSLYANSDIFLFPSECEGFGIPVIEAAAHGVPCVVADSTALSELREAYVGRAFEPSSFDAFVDAIEAVISDLGGIQERAHLNAWRVRHDYQWATVGGKFLQLIDRVEAAR